MAMLNKEQGYGVGIVEDSFCEEHKPHSNTIINFLLGPTLLPNYSFCADGINAFSPKELLPRQIRSIFHTFTIITLNCSFLALAHAQRKGYKFIALFACARPGVDR